MWFSDCVSLPRRPKVPPAPLPTARACVASRECAREPAKCGGRTSCTFEFRVLWPFCGFCGRSAGVRGEQGETRVATMRLGFSELSKFTIRSTIKQHHPSMDTPTRFPTHSLMPHSRRSIISALRGAAPPHPDAPHIACGLRSRARRRRLGPIIPPPRRRPLPPSDPPSESLPRLHARCSGAWSVRVASPLSVARGQSSRLSGAWSTGRPARTGSDRPRCRCRRTMRRAPRRRSRACPARGRALGSGGRTRRCIPPRSSEPPRG